VLVPLPPHSPRPGALWDAADVVLVVGSDLDAMNTQGFRQPQPPTLVTVDLVEPVNYEPDVLVRADARETLLRLAFELREDRREPWWTSPGPRPEMPFLDALEAGLPDDVVVVADMCVPGYWYGGYGRVRRPRALAYPVGWAPSASASPPRSALRCRTPDGCAGR
jgi:acetolactate synthase-1/2/3 large subunit